MNKSENRPEKCSQRDYNLGFKFYVMATTKKASAKKQY
jgi:hypothetical protein